MYITPFVYMDKDVNGVINTALIESLPKSFDPIVIGSNRSIICNRGTLLKARENLLVRAFFKFGPKSLTYTIRDLPDRHYYLWYYNALVKGRNYLKGNKVDYLHSISIPYSAHWVAMKLKRKYNLPWIAQFYEPWGDNTYRIDKAWVRKKNVEWERQVAEEADLIIHNSEEMVASWIQRYGKFVENKILSLPMSFKLDEPKDEKFESPRSNKLQICHIGNLYRLRRADTFLTALALLIEEYPSYKNLITVSFIGRVDQDDINLCKNLHLNDMVNFVGVISESECVDYYKTADLFLLIESPYQGKLFFPSKLIRYYYYCRPILGLTTDNSVLYNQLRKNGHYSCSSNDIDSIKKIIKKFVDDSSLPDNFNKEAWKEFEANNVANLYSDIVTNYMLK